MTDDRKIAEEFGGLVAQMNLSTNIQGREYVLVEGWTMLGSMLGIHAGTESVAHVDGVWIATVNLYDESGTVVGGGAGICADDENPWSRRPAYTRAAMAQTRAVGRALRQRYGHLVAMAGYAATSAEEMPHEDAPGPTPGERVRAEAKSLGLDAETAKDVLSEHGFRSSADVTDGKLDEVISALRLRSMQ